MKEDTNINYFPYDYDTVSIIEEIEEYLQLQHKNIMGMNECEIHKYINKLTLFLIKVKMN